MPFGFGEDRGWPSANRMSPHPQSSQPAPEPQQEPQPAPAPEPAPAQEPQPEQQPEPTPEPEPEPETQSAPEPESESTPESEEQTSEDKPKPKTKAKRKASDKSKQRTSQRALERQAERVLDVYEYVKEPAVRDAISTLTGRDSDEDLVTALLSLKPGMAGNLPDRKTIRQILDARSRLDDERVRRVMGELTGADSDAGMVAGLLNGRLDAARLLKQALDEQDPLGRMVILLSAGEKDANRLRAAARIMIALDPGLGETVKPNGGSLVDLSRAMASAVGGMDAELVGRLAS